MDWLFCSLDVGEVIGVDEVIRDVTEIVIENYGRVVIIQAREDYLEFHGGRAAM